MKPIAVFFHCRVSATGDAPIPFEHGISVVAKQVLDMRASGLEEAASEIHVGVNGGQEDTMAVASIAPGKANVIQHPDDAKGEHPTLHLMQHWVRSHPGWNVLYLHTKGATKPGNEFWERWRNCMMSGVVWRWQECVSFLDAGGEAAGCHWLTPARYPGIVNSPFFGGNFFFTTCDFISTLPLIEPSARDRAAFYDAESLIGRGPRPPRIRDFHPEWPGGNCR